MPSIAASTLNRIVFISPSLSFAISTYKEMFDFRLVSTSFNEATLEYADHEQLLKLLNADHQSIDPLFKLPKGALGFKLLVDIYDRRSLLKTLLSNKKHYLSRDQDPEFPALPAFWGCALLTLSLYQKRDEIIRIILKALDQVNHECLVEHILLDKYPDDALIFEFNYSLKGTLLMALDLAYVEALQVLFEAFKRAGEFQTLLEGDEYRVLLHALINPNEDVVKTVTNAYAGVSIEFLKAAYEEVKGRFDRYSYQRHKELNRNLNIVTRILDRANEQTQGTLVQADSSTPHTLPINSNLNLTRSGLSMFATSGAAQAQSMSEGQVIDLPVRPD